MISRSNHNLKLLILLLSQLISTSLAAVTDYSPLNTVTLEPSTTLKYRLTDSSTIQWSISSQSAGFIAFGLKMATETNQYDIVWGYGDGDNATITDSFYGNGVFDGDVALGGGDDLVDGSVVSNGGMVTMSWKKRISSGGDRYDAVVSVGRRIDVIWAMPKVGAGDSNALELDFSADGGNVRTGSFVVERLSWQKMETSLLTWFWYLNQEVSEIEMLMVGNTTGYVSVGLGMDMSKADIYLGYLSGNSVVVRDTWSTGYGNPPLDSEVGGTDDTYGVYGERVNSKTYIGFTRKLNTGDSLDVAITRGDTNVIWATAIDNKDDPNYHGANYGSGIINFYSGESKEESGLSGREIHGIWLTIAWGFLPPFFRWSYVYFSSNKFWSWAHLVLAILVVFYHVVGIAALDKGGNDGEGSGKDDQKELHELFGGLVFPLMMWLMITGLFSMYAMKWSKKRIPYIFKSHRLPVYVIFAVAAIAIYLGFYVIWESYLYLIFLWIIFVLAVELVLYYRSNFTKRKAVTQGKILTPKKPISQTFANYSEYLQVLQKNPKKRFAVYQNYILDLTDYVTHHPGGAFIFNNILAHDDVARWMYGGYGLNSQVSPHNHSVAAEEYLFKNLIYGALDIYQDVVQPRSIVIEGRTKLDAEEQASLSSISPHRGVWNLVHISQLTDDTSQFYFASETVKCNPKSYSLENMGRHFKITKKIGNQYVSRLYTTVFSLSDLRVQFRNKDMLRMGEKFGDESLKLLEPVVASRTDDKLNLVIKHYPVKAKLTPFLFSMEKTPKQTETFTIEGPGGLGLCLDSDSHGFHVIFGAGTGMLPFLDLFDYFLKELVNWSDNGQKSNFLDSFKLTIHASYPSRKKCVGLSLMEKCQTLATAMHFTAFNLNLYFGDETMQRFDEEFFKKQADEFQDVAKVYVCGPPRFNETIPQHLQRLGISQNRFFFVQDRSNFAF